MSKTGIVLAGFWLVATVSLDCRRGRPVGSMASGGAGGVAGSAGKAGAGGASGAGGGAGTGAGAGGSATGSAGDSGSVWTKAPTDDSCGLEIADPTRLTLLPFAWSVCGPGCLVTSALMLPTDVAVQDGPATASVEGGDVLLHLDSQAPGYTVVATRRLSDGGLLGAVRQTANFSSCVTLAWAASAPRVFAFAGGGSTSGSGAAAWVGFLNADGSFTWSPTLANVPVQTSIFENDLGWGMGFDDGTLATMFPPGSGALTTIDQGAIYPAHSAVARKSLVISNPALSGDQDAVLRAWEPTRSSRTIVAQSNTDVPSVALSDTSMVWAGTHGPQRTSGGYTAAELYWAAWPAGQDSVPIMGGTALPAIAGLLSLQTWGDYAALTGTNSAQKRVMFVVRLSDGKLWTIAARPGSFYMNVLAVSPTEILFGEIDDSGNPALGQQIQRLVRYDLAHLDNLSSAW
jgi:hypothetical protein